MRRNRIRTGLCLCTAAWTVAAVSGCTSASSRRQSTATLLPSVTATHAPTSSATPVFLYLFGGDDASQLISSCYSAEVLPGGGLGPWLSTSALPGGIGNPSHTFFGGRAFVYGGITASGASNQVWYSQISGGAMSPWSAASPIPVAGAVGGLAAASNRLWAWPVGATTAYSAALTGGLPGPWMSSTTSAPASVEAGHWGSDGSRIYQAGGADTVNPGNPVLDSTWSAPAPGTGNAGPWTAGAPLPSPVAWGAFAVTSGLFFVVGGAQDYWWSTPPRSSVYHAPIAGGVIGSWSTSASLPTALYQPSAVEAGGHLYVVGGLQAGLTSADTVFSGTVTPSGVSSWTQLPNLPYHVAGAGIAVR